MGLGNARFTPVGSDEERSQWFTINAGVGIDADVVASMEAQRAAGRGASGTRYAWTATQEYFGRMSRREHTSLSLTLPGQEPIDGLALAIIQNTAPWTFFGPFPINPCPRASFDSGLDVFAPHSLGLWSTTRYGLRMLRGQPGSCRPRPADPAARRGGVHPQLEEPVNLQIDGDSMGQVTSAFFRSRPACAADRRLTERRKCPCSGRNGRYRPVAMARGPRM